MRILFINHQSRLGGAELMLLKFLKYVDRKKFECALLSFNDGPLVKEAQEIGVESDLLRIADDLLEIRRKSKTFSLKYLSKSYQAIRDLRLFIRNSSPDLVISNSIKSHVLSSFALRSLPIPYAWRLHDIIDAEGFSYLQRKFLISLAKHCPSQIAAVSNATAEPLSKAGIGMNKLSVIYNGVEIEQPSRIEAENELRRNLNLSKKDFVITLPGRLIPSKGHKILLKAAEQIVKRFQNIRFLFVGESFYNEIDYKSSLQSALNEYSLNNYFSFVEFQNDMSPIYGISDVVVQPSQLPDSLPTVILEAMGSRKIVIASDLGGAKEIITNNKDGFLIEPDNPELLADRLISILTDMPRYRSIGPEAYDKILGKFSLRSYVSGMEKWLNGLVN